MMKDSIEKTVRDLGTICIENLVGTEVSTNMIGLYPEDYDMVASLFSCPEEKQYPINQKSGGTDYA